MEDYLQTSISYKPFVISRIVFPTLFSAGPISISSLGVLSFFAFLLGAFLFWRKAKEEGYEEEDLLDTSFAGAFLGIFTARVGFIIANWPEFGWSIANWLDFQHKGGLSFFGGVFGGIFVLWFLGKKFKWSFWPAADMAVFSIIWAQILVRFGQILEGGQYLTRFAEIIFLFAFLYWLDKLERQYRLFMWYQNKRGEAEPGFLVLTYGLLYSIFFFLLDFFRPSALYWLSLSLAQWVSLVLAVGIIVGFLHKMGRLEDFAKVFKERRERLKPRVKKLTTVLSIKTEPRERPKPLKKKHYKTGSDAKV